MSDPSVTHPSPPVADPADICTVDEVAVWLGVDRKTVYTAARHRQIPCGRMGRRIVMSRAAIARWLAGGHA